MIADSVIPHWNLKDYFPGLDSPEFANAFGDLEIELTLLESTFDEFKVGFGDAGLNSLSGFDAATRAFNVATDHLRFIGTYVNCFVDTDSRNEIAQSKQSELDPLRVRLLKLRTRWVRWVGGLDEMELLDKTAEGKSHAFAIAKAKVLSTKQMSAVEEDLAADLQLSGSSGWEKLYGNATSQLEVQLLLHGESKTITMSGIRNLAYDSDPTLRESAYVAELGAWKGSETILAAALNGIKGEFLTLSQRRGWKDPIDSALFNAHIDQATLDAMMSAAKERFPAFRRYLRAKGKRLGYVGPMPWHGLFAPITSGESSSWPYAKACAFIEKSFSGYSSELAQFARHAFDNDWVDAEPRPGKSDGGYCSWTRDGESRIFMNYKPSFGSVSTLAHELGHAYHNLMLKDRPALQRQTPMTLAETASIFCETIIRRAGLQVGSDEEKLSILEASLMGSCQIVVDISSRFLFEQSVFAKRREREVNPSEFCAMMLDAQRQTYGDGIDADQLHPYMWAAKPHYYDGGYCYYNYPYMFGLLFGLGLYAVYEREPEGFHARYDELLSSTGLADAATCASWFGIDIRDVAFWRGSLDVIERDIDRFVELVG